MDTSYTKYTADQLLNDKFFLESEVRPTKESKLFWKNLEREDETLAKEIRLARTLLYNIKRNADIPQLSNEKVEDLWRRINEENKRYSKRSGNTFRIAASIAASICLLIIAGWYFLEKQEPVTDYAAILEAADPAVVDPSGKVQLVLADNKKIEIEGKETEVDYQGEGFVNINSQEEVDLITESRKEEESLNQLIVPLGKRSTITFKDGTRIWLNAGSRIIYPVNFDKNKREIFAEGEIYLDVTPDEKRPFIVKTHQVDVKVLGTQFNISAYKDESDLHVVLVSGKVEVNMEGKEKNILNPNQMFTFNNNTHKGRIANVDVSDYIAWKDGYYQFYQQRLSVILSKLTKYYGIQFRWDNKLTEFSCSGKLDLKDDLNDVLLALAKAAPIEIDKTNETIYVKVKP